MVKLLSRSGPLGRGLEGDTAERLAGGSQQGVVLLALARASGCASSGRLAYVDRLKANMVKYGLLARLAAAAGAAGTQLAAAAEAGEAAEVAAADAVWQLHLVCLVFEQSTFTCPEVEQHVVGLTMELGPPGAGAVPLPLGLLRLLPLLQARLAQVQPQGQQVKDCLHATLAVLMNLSHHNAAGVEAILGGGGLLAGTCLLRDLLQPWAPGQRSVDRGQVGRGGMGGLGVQEWRSSES